MPEWSGLLNSLQVNSYSGSTPAAPTNLNSRGVTRGAYRGFGEVYDVSLPAGTIVAGSNTVSSVDMTCSESYIDKVPRSPLPLPQVAPEIPISAPTL